MESLLFQWRKMGGWKCWRCMKLANKKMGKTLLLGNSLTKAYKISQWNY
jgi:hypothetical protein